MGDNGASSGSLTIKAALQRARDPNQEEDPVVTAFLEATLREIWQKIETRSSYVLTKRLSRLLPDIGTAKDIIVVPHPNEPPLGLAPLRLAALRARQPSSHLAAGWSRQIPTHQIRGSANVKTLSHIHHQDPNAKTYDAATRWKKKGSLCLGIP
jgi:hypothetical protein